MKHTLIAIVLLLHCYAVKAQFEKNSAIIGGSGSYISQKRTINGQTSRTETYSIDPVLLIQSSGDFSAGLTFGYFHDYYRSGSGENGSINEWKVGPAARYQKKFIDNFSGYVQFSFTYGKGKSEEDALYDIINRPATFNTEYSQVLIGVFPGVNYKLSKHFYLDLRYGNLEYGTATINTEIRTSFSVSKDEETQKEFSVNLGFETLKVGLLYTFK